MQMRQQLRPFAKVPTGANTLPRKRRSLWAGLDSILPTRTNEKRRGGGAWRDPANEEALTGSGRLGVGLTADGARQRRRVAAAAATAAQVGGAKLDVATGQQAATVPAVGDKTRSFHWLPDFYRVFHLIVFSFISLGSTWFFTVLLGFTELIHWFIGFTSIIDWFDPLFHYWVLLAYRISHGFIPSFLWFLVDFVHFTGLSPFVTGFSQVWSGFHRAEWSLCPRCDIDFF